MSYCSAALWIVACWTLLSMRFLRQECWSGLPFPPPVDLPNTGIKPVSPVWQVDSLPLSYLGSPHRPQSLFRKQCSCLENPRDGGAWWAAIYGVPQSWTRLKRLSSSSSSCCFSYHIGRTTIEHFTPNLKVQLPPYWIKNWPSYPSSFLKRKKEERNQLLCYYKSPIISPWMLS